MGDLNSDLLNFTRLKNKCSVNKYVLDNKKLGHRIGRLGDLYYIREKRAALNMWDCFLEHSLLTTLSGWPGVVLTGATLSLTPNLM